MAKTLVTPDEQSVQIVTGFSAAGDSGSDGGSTYHATNQASVTFTLSKASRVLIEASSIMLQSLTGGTDQYARIYTSTGTPYGNEGTIRTVGQYHGGAVMTMADIPALPAGTYTFTTWMKTANGSVGFITKPSMGYIKATIFNS